jgi:choline dehydrogenase-like flavoprotein
MARPRQPADVLIIGSGATGAIAARVLGTAGLDVVCLEQGGWVTAQDHPQLHADWQWQRRARWNADVNLRSNADDFAVRTDSSHVLMWNAVGGSTNVHAIGDDLPDPENRVSLDPAVVDAEGVPIAQLRYHPGENDRRMMRYMRDRLVEIAGAADAFDYRLQDYVDAEGVYRTPAWHLLGTCRMGAAPEMSVVNKWQQCWDVPNLFIVDGSVLTTGGVVNPTPTICALALRAAEHLRDNFHDLRTATRPTGA